jgi:putative endonuclease
MYKVYILQSLKDRRTYVGFTDNIGKRLKEHNSGKVAATCNRRPFKIIYLENVDNFKDAKERELYWKSGAGRRKLKHYFNEGFPPIEMGEARS